MEMVTINAQVCPDVAERIGREVKRQEIANQLSRIMAAAKNEGFSFVVANSNEKVEDRRKRTVFSDVISLPSELFTTDFSKEESPNVWMD